MDRVQLIETLREAEDTAELRAFETQLFDKETHVYVDDIASYSGIEFEGFLRQLFVKMGYVVELTKITGDQGADLVVEKLHERSVVQAKRFAAKVGNKAVQEIMAAISIYKADKGIVVTNNYFTTAAMELAEANNIGMINREKLEELINKYW